MGRNYRKLTQELILDRLRSGTVVVDFDRMEVLSTIKAETINGNIEIVQCDPFPLAFYPSGRNDEYLMMRFRWKGARGSVMVHRLAWLAHYETVIPEGLYVDHKDDNTRNWHWSNLQLLTHPENIAKREARYGSEDTLTTFT